MILQGYRERTFINKLTMNRYQVEWLHLCDGIPALSNQLKAHGWFWSIMAVKTWPIILILQASIWMKLILKIRSWNLTLSRAIKVVCSKKLAYLVSYSCIFVLREHIVRSSSCAKQLLERMSVGTPITRVMVFVSIATKLSPMYETYQQDLNQYAMMCRGCYRTEGNCCCIMRLRSAFLHCCQRHNWNMIRNIFRSGAFKWKQKIKALSRHIAHARAHTRAEAHACARNCYPFVKFLIHTKHDLPCVRLQKQHLQYPCPAQIFVQIDICLQLSENHGIWLMRILKQYEHGTNLKISQTTISAAASLLATKQIYQAIQIKPHSRRLNLRLHIYENQQVS